MSDAPATMPAKRGSAPTRGAWLREVWASSIGKKQIVALTGFVLIAYVVAHMLGNLKAFQEGTAIDSYGEWIRTVGDPVIPRNGVLWAFRALLLFSFVVHIVGVAQLATRNRAARPAGYRPATQRRTWSTKTMQFGGIVLLFFIVFHILHFTTGTIEPSAWAEGAVFSNLEQAFDNPFFVAIYVLVPVALGLHLRHAIWSTTQTAGWDKPNRNPTIRRMSNVIALGVTVGFAAIPIAFWTGVIG